MKILQVTVFFKPSWEAGGVARVAYEISRNLIKEGHEVTVYTTDGFKFKIKSKKNRPVDVDGINTYYFKNLFHYLIKMNITTPYYLPFVARKKIKDFDIIHIHEHRTLLAIIVHYYAKKYNIPYVVQAHGSLPNTFGKQMQKKIFDAIWGNNILKDASKLISVSTIEVDQYLQMNVPAEKVIVIPNGIDLDSFSELPKKGSFRKKYNINEKHIILFLGRLHEIKGIDFLIKSYAKLIKERTNVILVLAGPDDGYLEKAKSLVEELTLKEHVKFTGFINGAEKLAAYVDADVLVYPSIFEIFGLVPFEAIMCGTPVIVTDNCGCGELIKESKSGYLVRYGNIDDLKEKLKLSIEGKDYNAFVDNGRDYVEKKLSWESIVFKIESLYEDCIPNK
jgi:glycosyltransferase involved in cell wall biosynthesis